LPGGRSRSLAPIAALDPRRRFVLVIAEILAHLLIERGVDHGGTIRNCAGGPTPWGSWPTCEETTDLNPRSGARHGYVFEVSATGRGDAAPIKAMGRLAHEAVAVHPATRWVSVLAQVVAGSCDPVGMELTAADFERIPGENLRVPRDEFVAVWALAERRADAGSIYALGVAKTCRWIAHAKVPAVIFGPEPAWPPVTHQQITADPDTIEAETRKAAIWYALDHEDREGHWDPGLLEGIAETFHWVWWECDFPPLDIRKSNAS
jgi:hypothetical protein